MSVVEESFAYKTAPTAHHPLIGFSVGEKLSFVHVDAPHVLSQGDFAALYVRKPFAWKMSRGCDTNVRFGSEADIAARHREGERDPSTKYRSIVTCKFGKRTRRPVQ
jgi:hypothetical protein